jgi:hypothetical protein
MAPPPADGPFGQGPRPAQRVDGKLWWFLGDIEAASEASRNPVGLPDFKS